MRRQRLIRTSATITALGALLVGVAGPAAATYPGRADGRLAAFRIVDGNADVYSVLPNGHGWRRLTTDPSFDACPSYAPDGRSIAFCSDRGLDGGYEIWTMAHNGTQQVQLTSLGGFALFPDYSPDGERIVFEVAEVPGGDEASDIYVIGTEGLGLQRLTMSDDWEFAPVWSPDGARIAYVRELPDAGPQLFVMDADGSDQQQLTTLGSGAFDPDWSPDGTRLVFESDTTIHVLDLTTGAITPLDAGDVRGFGPVWSPTGDRIGFVHLLDGTFDGPRELALMALDGTGVRTLGPARGVPSWQARGPGS